MHRPVDSRRQIGINLWNGAIGYFIDQAIMTAAHFLLGRVYLRDRSIVKAKREFDLAWQINPERFEGAYARLRTQRDGVPELFSYTGGRRVGVATRCNEEHYDDFRSEGERRRFEDLPPITRDDISRIDWDQLEEQLWGR